MADQSELALIQATLDGDTDSFTKLCQRYYPAMVAIARSTLNDSHFAEDAAQQALAKAFCRLATLKKKEKFAAWLATICRNIARDMLRTKAKISIIDKIAVPVTNVKQKDNELTETVRDAVKSLSASLKEVIYLRYYDNMPYNQIAQLLGISKTAVDGRIRRAKKLITKYLNRNGFKEGRL